MDEDQMWKSLYEKMQEAKRNFPSECETSLQNSDGGFFEKFGLLLRQKTESQELESTAQLALFQENGNEDKEACACDDQIASSDLELEINSNKFDNMEIQRNFVAKATCINIEDLYEEIIFEICNNIGGESDISTDILFEFVQNMFKVSDEKHTEILTIAKRKEPPSLRLNVEIIKAENLLPKDANGLSDPFVTLYLESNSAHRYNSSVKPATLSPNWEEHFSLPIADSPATETLTIEVWDFDAAETIKEKANKIFDVKGVRGLRKLMKEIAITASTGKHDNELIGRTSVSLKSIPITGMTAWYNLEKGARTKNRGSILVNLALSAEKHKQVAVQEHRHLLRLLLLHELEGSQYIPFRWNGQFSAKAEVIRSQHSVHSGLSPFECALSNWAVYTSIHEDYPLSFSIFNSILNVIIPVLKCLHWNCEDVKIFWEGVRRILPSCYSIIRKLRCKSLGDKLIVNLLCEVLDILAVLNTLDVPSEFDLFPKNSYGWTSREDSAPYDLNQGLIDAAVAGSKEWFEGIIEAKMTINDEAKFAEDCQLQYLIKLIQIVRADLQRAMEYYDKHFYQKIRINFSSILFKMYDPKIADIVKSTVTEVCGHIERLQVPDDAFDFIPNINNVNMGTSLFELYLILRRFLELGKLLCPSERLVLDEFHVWFMPGVTHWLDISILKALTRISKAIQLDTLKVVDETVKYSSSAIDTLAIFYQIKIFWQQLDWPDVESCYTFLAKIIDDICRCCVFYAQKMSCRVGGDSNNDDLLEVSVDWCIAINNIDYLRQSLRSFIKELGVDLVIEKLGDYRSNVEADRCALTIQNVVDNALDTQRNQILELIEIVAKKMTPPQRRFLAEGAEVLHENSNSMEKLMLYLENSLTTLWEALNELNFERILDAIWSELSIILYDLIQHNLDKRRPPAFFQNLRETLRTLVSCFKIGSFEESHINVLSEIGKILDLHSLETADLIHQYYIYRSKEVQKDIKSDYGQLTIKGHFTTSSLELTIMNARNLVPIEKNGFCNSFVKASLLPFNRFCGTSPIKTASQNKTCFPLYDEVFTINLSQEQLSYDDSLILFCIKDKDLFGMKNRNLAECFITFSDIKNNEKEQIHLVMVKPEFKESDISRALEQRHGDKQAKEFLKKLKAKSM